MRNVGIWFLNFIQIFCQRFYKKIFKFLFVQKWQNNADDDQRHHLSSGEDCECATVILNVAAIAITNMTTSSDAVFCRRHASTLPVSIRSSHIAAIVGSIYWAGRRSQCAITGAGWIADIGTNDTSKPVWWKKLTVAVISNAHTTRFWIAFGSVLQNVPAATNDISF